MSSNSEIRDRLANNDVTVARSYLEVDVMEWFSDNEIAFAYEPFVIPSVVGPSTMTWTRMTEAIKALGNGNQQAFESQTQDTPLADVSAFEALGMWNEIYDKHRLAEEQITVPVRESLQRFNKSMVLPDFTLYTDLTDTVVGEGFDYGDYDFLVEVSGLYGVGLPGEATEDDWWDWYRVSAVAFKEYIYKMLDLWDKVYWVIPNQTYIEGVSDGIPRSLREDDHYVIVNTTAANIQLDKLEDAIGITAENVAGGLTPPIDLTTYDRPRENFLPGEFERVEWTYDDVVVDAVNANQNAVALDDDMIVFHGELGEVYVSPDGVQVRESQWRNTNMIMLREYVVSVLQQLDEDGIVTGVVRVE